MRCVFQLLRRVNGGRSPVAECTREEYAELLQDMQKSHPDFVHDDDYVLVLTQRIGEPEAEYSCAPAMRVDWFIKEYLPGSK